MKSLWKGFVLLAVLVLAVTACGPAAAPTGQPTTVQPAETSEIAVPPVATIGAAAAPVGTQPIVVAVPVASSPVADGSASDEQWKDAPVTKIGGMSWSAVYTDKQLTMLLKWQDRDLSINTSGNATWDPITNTWTLIDPTPAGLNSDWINFAWEIGGTSMFVGGGCNVFCHEDPPGSGLTHHQTTAPDKYFDDWLMEGKHGFSYQYVKGIGGVQSEAAYGFKLGKEDTGWTVGSISAKQNGPVIFDTLNKSDPHSIIGGNLTFIGYAQDLIITGHGSTVDAAQDRPRDLYCKNCHTQLGLPYNPLDYDLTRSDEGEIEYFGNYDVPLTIPKYMEKAPTDFADAMIITQSEIDDGEAVLVADLTPAQITEYWANYYAVNGVIPINVLKTPTSSMADVLIGLNWNNGIYTLEIQRNLTTDFPAEDVQFNDLTKDYAFGVSGVGNYADYVKGVALANGGILRFKH